MHRYTYRQVQKRMETHMDVQEKMAYEQQHQGPSFQHANQTGSQAWRSGIGGQALVVRHWWSGIGGHTLVVRLWLGQALVVRHWWPGIGGQALVARHWWSGIGGQAHGSHQGRLSLAAALTPGWKGLYGNVHERAHEHL